MLGSRPKNFPPYNIRVQWVDSTTSRGSVQNWLNTARAEKSWLLLVYHEIGMSTGHDTFNTATTDLDAEMKAVPSAALAWSRSGTQSENKRPGEAEVDVTDRQLVPAAICALR